jgi:hypothetical protein
MLVEKGLIWAICQVAQYLDFLPSFVEGTVEDQADYY